MKEQSHKDEMGAAVRGDFERLRARRGEAGTHTAVRAPERAVERGPERDEMESVHPEPVTFEPVTFEPVPPEPAPPSWLTRLGIRR